MNKTNTRLNATIFNPRWYTLKSLVEHLKVIMAKYISPLGNDLTIIDYGCGHMPYKELLLNVVNKYIGVDLEENKSAEVHITPTGTINLRDNFSDIVLSTQVLEHVVDPVHYIAECKRVLKKDGLMILSTHGYWIYHPDPTDYWRWTSSGLKKIIEDAGFEILYFKGIVARAGFGLQLIQDSLIFKVPKFVVPIISLPFQIGILLLDKILASSESRDSDASVFMTVCKVKK